MGMDANTELGERAAAELIGPCCSGTFDERAVKLTALMCEWGLVALDTWQ